MSADKGKLKRKAYEKELKKLQTELCYLQAKFAALASYRVAATLLAELLPLGRPLHATAVRRHAQAVAERLEDELGPEQPSFIDSCQRDRAALPRPDLPLLVSLDGGYVHSSQQQSRRDGWFEVIAGRATPADGPAKCFGFVQTYDTKPKRRLFDLLISQGMQANQAVTFLTDGGDDVRDLPLYLNPDSEHLLDWFHVTVRLIVMTNMAKSLRAAPPDEEGLPPPADPAAAVAEGLQRLKWFCWHGNVVRALYTISDLETDAEVADPSPGRAKFLKTLREFDTYIRAQRRLHPQLRRALPGRRSHLQLDSRVRRQPGDQRTDGQETADAVEPPRHPPAPTAPHPGPQRLTRRRLPPVAPRIHPRARPTGAGRVTSPNLSRSPYEGTRCKG